MNSKTLIAFGTAVAAVVVGLYVANLPAVKKVLG